MITTRPVSYSVVSNAAAKTVKAGRGEFYGFVALTGGALGVEVRDGGSGGTLIYTSAATAFAAGDAVHFGGLGILCAKDIHVTITGSGTANILFV